MLTTPTAHQPLPQTKKQCRFYLFIRWRPGRRAYGAATSCYNGDRYKDQLSEQLIRVIKLFEKYKEDAAVAMVYDNTKGKHDEEYPIVKLTNGVLEVNRVRDFQALLDGYSLPAILK
jgi:hypothetical protein